MTVVDNLPLLWDDDLVASFDTTEFGSNPTVIIENVGTLELSDLRVTWTVCNSITGICHSSGVSHNLGPFIVNPSSGSGLGIGDYVTLSVSAEDQNGFDRLTEIQYKVFASEPVENTEPEPARWYSFSKDSISSSSTRPSASRLRAIRHSPRSRHRRIEVSQLARAEGLACEARDGRGGAGRRGITSLSRSSISLMRSAFEAIRPNWMLRLHVQYRKTRVGARAGGEERAALGAARGHALVARVRPARGRRGRPACA